MQVPKLAGSRRPAIPPLGLRKGDLAGSADAGFSLRALGSTGISYAARPGHPKGPEGWGELYPDGLYEALMRFSRELPVPLYVTENGVPDESDEVRPGFLARHLQRCWLAIQADCPLKGYYFWRLVDNFEWAEGSDPRFRFGLYGVDFATQERMLRRSGDLYGSLVHGNAIEAEKVGAYAPEVAVELFGGHPGG